MRLSVDAVAFPGLLAAGGISLNQFNIFGVVDNSPAANAGVLPGDRLIRINGFPAALLTMEGITRKLQKSVGKKIKIVVERDGENIKMAFRLKELI